MARRPGALGLLLTLLVTFSLLVAAPPSVALDKDCGDFGSQRDAQIFFLNHGGPNSDPHNLDSDSDGIACESNPPPYYYGTTPPGGGQEPEPEVTSVRSTVNLALVPDKRIKGESFRMKVTVRPAISRKVLVQRRVDGRWRPFGDGTTGRDGKTSGVFKAPKANVTYRVVLKPHTKGNKKYSAATSKARTLHVQRQRVVLEFDDRTVSEGEQVRAVVRATPVRARRPVALQMWSAGSWHTVKTGRLDRRGRASFVITAALGEDAYRAVALRHRGATPHESRAVTVTAQDVTPPTAPFDLVAVAGDGSVQLSWSRELPADFAHHEVWMRAGDDAWSMVAVTEEDDVELTALQNGVTYSFTVTSVDGSGNASPPATVVTATPTAPDPEPRD